ncbi:TIGR04104 family putative zinc finger protein [Bacillus massiliglaciei]|uniref:TIGR04104 family putative zinc finger protein n=1 Tax=Bacillus massiliglaciei TaxID=1816693 RepID=UPI000DA5F027|nr:TIGR04104 family putative zinc finger protein [Bacillus massiliglaciei]
MPTCQCCGKKWSWAESMKKLVTFRKEMKCPYCGEAQYQSTASRNTIVLLSLIPVIILPLSVLFQLPLVTMICLDAVLLLLIWMLMPIFLKITDKDEPLW